MFRVPFGKELDEVFRGDRSIWLKVLGCGFVASALVVSMLLRERSGAAHGQSGLQVSNPVLAIVGVLSAIAGCILGVLLSLKDVVRLRIDQGRAVHPLLSLYFASRFKSLAMWIVTVLVAIMVVTFTITVANEHR